jgi:hypothetical protein
VTDCWAQGSVPKNIIPSRPISPVAEEFDEHPNYDQIPTSHDFKLFKIKHVKNIYYSHFELPIFLFLSISVQNLY